MEQVGHFPFVKQAGLTAVELPYAGNELSLIAILSDGDIDELADGLYWKSVMRTNGALQKGVGAVRVTRQLPLRSTSGCGLSSPIWH